MKVDKETLVKHHFWILLGIVAPLVLIALCTLWFGAASDIKKKEDEFEKMKKQLADLKNKSGIKNTHWVNVLEQKEKKVADQKDKVWKEVWEAQSDLMTWPQALANEYEWLGRLYFLDDFYPPEVQDTTLRLRISSKFKDQYVNTGAYQTQIEPLVNIVDPVDAKGHGTVQYAGGWQSIITHVPKWPASPPPTVEQIWLAQEDLWVQRELLNVIKESNTFLSKYKKEPNPPKAAKNELDRQVFTNPYWKLELTLEQDQVRWQITNLGKQIQPLGMRYLIKFTGSNTPNPILVDGEPLAPRHSTKGEEKRIKVVGRTRLEEVRQELNWRTAPVKRIDKLALAWHSQRTSTRALQGPPAKEGEGGDGTTASTEQPSGGADNDMAAMMGAMSAMGKRQQMMGAGGLGGQSTELIQRIRYMDFGPQVRRMAVGMVLIVDQAHIQDVLAAFANSKLRMQITQVHWQHYAGSIKPPIMEMAGAPPGAPGSNLGSVPASGEDDVRPRGGVPSALAGKFRPGGTPGAGMSFGQPFAGAQSMSFGSASDEPTNLVELAVYGIGSLYQRYPPKDTTAAAEPAKPAG
jgi:hypothetical protein